MPVSTPNSTAIKDEIYLQVRHFISAQMQMMDRGDFEEWAATFTEDGVFDANGLPEPVRGRATLAAAARKAREQEEPGLVIRHWLGMLAVEPRPDGTVSATCYALVIRTPRGGDPVIHRATSCTDVLVREGDGWLVRERRIRRDDLPT